MAAAATNARLLNFAHLLRANCIYLNAFGQPQKSLGNMRLYNHSWAGICQQNSRDGTAATMRGLP